MAIGSKPSNPSTAVPRYFMMLWHCWSPRKAVSVDGGPATRDFVSDAFAHSKFIAYAEAAAPLITASYWRQQSGREALSRSKPSTDAALFVKACRRLRFWERKSR